jgi:hypothetical protein
MHDHCLLLDLDAIQVQCGRESKKRRKIDENASKGLIWILLWIFYHLRNTSLKQTSTLNVPKSRYESEKRNLLSQTTEMLSLGCPNIRKMLSELPTPSAGRNARPSFQKRLSIKSPFAATKQKQKGSLTGLHRRCFQLFARQAPFPSANISTHKRCLRSRQTRGGDETPRSPPIQYSSLAKFA